MLFKNKHCPWKIDYIWDKPRSFYLSWRSTQFDSGVSVFLISHSRPTHWYDSQFNSFLPFQARSSSFLDSLLVANVSISLSSVTESIQLGTLLLQCIWMPCSRREMIQDYIYSSPDSKSRFLGWIPDNMSPTPPTHLETQTIPGNQCHLVKVPLAAVGRKFQVNVPKLSLLINPQLYVAFVSNFNTYSTWII